MDSDEAAARERGLEKAFAALPDEIAAAIALARAQREALPAMPPEPDAL